MILGLFFLALIATATYAYTTLTYVRSTVSILRTSSEDARPALADLRNGNTDAIDDLVISFDEISQALEGLDSRLKNVRRFSVTYNWIPSFGEQVEDAFELIDIGLSLTDSLAQVIPPLVAISDVVREEGITIKGPGANPNIVALIMDNSDLWNTANKNLKNITEKSAALRADSTNLVISDAAADIADISLEASTAFSLLSDLTTVLRSIGSYGESKTYLIVPLNNDELRGGGGFTPGAWTARVSEGTLETINFFDTLTIDDFNGKPNPSPPTGIRIGLYGGIFYFRDGAWDPDFPTTAATLSSLFELGTGIHIDGVIAVDQLAITEFEQSFLGSLDGSSPETSIISILQSGTDEFGHKFLHDVLQDLIIAFTAIPLNQYPRLAESATKLGNQKHLMVYFADEKLQSLVSRFGIAASLPPVDGDFLMVVDNNIGLNKSSTNIERTIHRSVDLTSEPFTAITTVNYGNHSSTSTVLDCESQAAALQIPLISYEEIKNGCHLNYVRILTSPGNQFTSVPSAPVPDGTLYRTSGANDLGNVWSISEYPGLSQLEGLVQIPAGDARSFAFSEILNLPDATRDTDEIEYSLILPKQPGALASTAWIDIAVPDGYEPASTTHNYQQIGNIFRFIIVVDSDVRISVKFRPQSMSSESVEQQIDSDAFPQPYSRTISIPVGSAVAMGVPFISNTSGITPLLVNWNLLNSSAGKLTSSGIFTAVATPGEFDQAIEFTVTDSDLRGIINVIVVEPQPLDMVLNSVSTEFDLLSIISGESAGIAAYAWSENGSTISDARFDFEVSDSSIGSFDSIGIFTAGVIPGTYKSSIKVTAIQNYRGTIIREERFITVSVVPE